MKNKTDQIDSPASGYDRRGFLRRLLVGAGLAGLGASLAAGACRCEDDDTEWSDDSESRGGATVSAPDDKSDQATDKSGSGEGSGETGGSSTEGSGT